MIGLSVFFIYSFLLYKYVIFEYSTKIRKSLMFFFQNSFLSKCTFRMSLHHFCWTNHLWDVNINERNIIVWMYSIYSLFQRNKRVFQNHKLQNAVSSTIDQSGNSVYREVSSFSSIERVIDLNETDSFVLIAFFSRNELLSHRLRNSTHTHDVSSCYVILRFCYGNVMLFFLYQIIC